MVSPNQLTLCIDATRPFTDYKIFGRFGNSFQLRTHKRGGLLHLEKKCALLISLVYRKSVSVPRSFRADRTYTRTLEFE